MMATNGHSRGGINTSGEDKDITTRKILLEIEKSINGLLKKHLKNTPQSVFVLDWSLEILYMNPAFERLTGFRKEDTATGNAILNIHPDDREKIEMSMIMAIVGTTTQCQCRIRGSEGPFHTLTLRVSPLRLDERCLVLCLDNGSAPEKNGMPKDQE